MNRSIKSFDIVDFNWPLRKPRRLDGVRRYPRIEVVGPMRVGKTTALELIEKWLKDLKVPVKLFYEDWQNNPYLKASYENPRKAFLKSQKWFIKRKFEQLKEGNSFKGVKLHDQSPEGDLCYPLTRLMLGEMSQDEFEEYWREYRRLKWQKVGGADLVVCLTITDRGLLSRQLRKFEKVEGGKYLRVMNRVHRGLMRALRNNINALVIDAGDINFSPNGADEERLIRRVRAKLNKTGFEWMLKKGTKSTKNRKSMEGERKSAITSPSHRLH